jgi:hypothetical protein
MHHLRFDSEAAKRQVAAAPALRVEGVIRHPPLEQPLEYFVIIAIRNDRGEEVTRQVVNVGALQAAEKRTFTLSVEVLPPQAPVATKSGATGTFKAPTPQPATAKPATSAQGGTPSSTATASTPGGPGSPSPGAQQAPTRPTTGSNPPGVGTNPAGTGTNPPGLNPAGRGANPTSSNPTGSKPTGANPTGTNPAAGGTANPGARPTDPASPPKPTSGYVLKPPSPGGPKRH